MCLGYINCLLLKVEGFIRSIRRPHPAIALVLEAADVEAVAEHLKTARLPSPPVIMMIMIMMTMMLMIMMMTRIIMRIMMMMMITRMMMMIVRSGCSAASASSCGG